ncbi:hypothetical protein KEC33_004887 [Salmonella enterica]|nr:hypothetical protein [Salmonella enterica]
MATIHMGSIGSAIHTGGDTDPEEVRRRYEEREVPGHKPHVEPGDHVRRQDAHVQVWNVHAVSRRVREWKSQKRSKVGFRQ